MEFCTVYVLDFALIIFFQKKDSQYKCIHIIMLVNKSQ